jgi:hypothetical protein
MLTYAVHEYMAPAWDQENIQAQENTQTREILKSDNTQAQENSRPQKIVRQIPYRGRPRAGNQRFTRQQSPLPLAESMVRQPIWEDLEDTLNEEITRPLSSRQERHEAVKAASKAKWGNEVPFGVLTESQAKARHEDRVKKKGNPPRRKPRMTRAEEVAKAIDAKISSDGPRIWNDDESDSEPAPEFDLAKGFPPVGGMTKILTLREGSTDNQSQPI